MTESAIVHQIIQQYLTYSPSAVLYPNGILLSVRYKLARQRRENVVWWYMTQTRP